jgi:hypothetical protein
VSNGKFFTFPVPILAMALPEKDILQHIIAHGVERAGSGGEAGSITKGRIAQELSERITGFNRRDERHDRIVRGAIICCVSLGNIGSTISRANVAARFVAEQEAKHGASPLVFISTELLWSCHNEDFPSYRDFTTLCAINSVIGFKKSPVLIRRQMIIARQLGYKSPAVMAAEIGNRRDRQPLTTKQLRDVLDRLETEDVISRYQASPRNVYFSTTLKYDELKSAVDTARAKRGKVAFRREIERGTATGPKQGHLKREPAKEEEKGPLKNRGPSEDHNGATTGATSGATKINVSKEMSANKSGDPTKLIRSAPPAWLEDLRKLQDELSTPPQPQT